MTLLPAGVKVHLAFGYTDMRKGMDGLTNGHPMSHIDDLLPWNWKTSTVAE